MQITDTQSWTSYKVVNISDSDFKLRFAKTILILFLAKSRIVKVSLDLLQYRQRKSHETVWVDVSDYSETWLRNKESHTTGWPRRWESGREDKLSRFVWIFWKDLSWFWREFWQEMSFPFFLLPLQDSLFLLSFSINSWPKFDCAKDNVDNIRQNLKVQGSCEICDKLSLHWPNAFYSIHFQSLWAHEEFTLEKRSFFEII